MATAIPGNQIGQNPFLRTDAQYDIGSTLNQNAPQAPDWWSANAPPNNGPMTGQPGGYDSSGIAGGLPRGPGRDIYGQPQIVNNPYGSASAAPAGGYNLQWLQGLIAGRPWNQETFNSLLPQFQAAGIQVTPPNANGEQTKINIPGQGWVRVGFGEGQPVWIPQGDGSAGGGGAANPYGSPTDFMTLDPGYQFRLQQGTDAMQKSAAARGTLLTGGLQKALARYNQDYASGEFGNVFNRNFNLAQLGKPSA